MFTNSQIPLKTLFSRLERTQCTGKLFKKLHCLAVFQNRPSVQSVNREENLEFLEGKFCKDMPSLFH